MDKVHIVMYAFAVYGVLTIGVSFVVWMNSSPCGDSAKPDVYLGNFWKWGIVITLIILALAFLSVPAG
jgi:magnesium-transporting ATPase (P-type)